MTKFESNKAILKVEGHYISLPIPLSGYSKVTSITMRLPMYGEAV